MTSFSLVNNMIVISAEVNGKRLSFLLDTGIKTTMLFNLKVVDSVELRNVEVIKLRGLGEGNSINAMKSHGNYFKFKDTLPLSLVSSVISQYSCEQCSSTYIGLTRKQMKVRISNHKNISFRTGASLNTPENSKIFE